MFSKCQPDCDEYPCEECLLVQHGLSVGEKVVSASSFLLDMNDPKERGIQRFLVESTFKQLEAYTEASRAKKEKRTVQLRLEEALMQNAELKDTIKRLKGALSAVALSRPVLEPLVKDRPEDEQDAIHMVFSLVKMNLAL